MAYFGIDERQIKCCDTTEGTIMAGISFDQIENGTQLLRFHFLDQIEKPDGSNLVVQKTKSMWLNLENTEQLISELQEIKAALISIQNG